MEATPPPTGGRPSFKCSYAKQYLEERGISITAGNKRILGPIGRTIYKTCKLKTGFFVGEMFVDKREIHNITDYGKLKSLGFCIIGKAVEDKTRYGQRVQYQLLWNTGAYRDVRSMPRDHYVEYDSYNKQARLVGPNVGKVSQFVGVPGRRPGGTGRNRLYVEDYCKQPEAIMRRITSGWIDMPEEPYFVPIKEIPFMISESGEIVCIPQSADEFTAAVLGERGSGKTFLLLAILSRMYHTPGWNKHFIILNDWQRECGTWCMPNDNMEQYVTLRKINQIPMPLPCVYIHPHVKDHFDMINEKEVGYQITMPYEEIITNFKKYMALQKTSVYFQRLRNDLLACSSLDDVDNLLKVRSDKKLTPKEDLIDSNSAKKIKAYVGNVLDDEITEKNTNIPHAWTIRMPNGETHTYNPITACMFAGLIPVFETETLSSYDFFQPYMRYFIEDVFNRQIRDSSFKNRNTAVYFFIDELHTLSSTQQKGVVDNILKRVIREGRPRRIGTIIADQKFHQITSEIKDNMNYVITFVNPGEAAEIASTYKLGKHYKDEIATLDKFECIAWSTGEPFVVYTRDGEVYKTKGPIKGRSLPPLSLHKKPKKSNNV